MKFFLNFFLKTDFIVNTSLKKIVLFIAGNICKKKASLYILFKV